jgi:hypothetical protein
MGSLLAVIVRTISEYIKAVPGALLHMAMDAGGDGVIDGDPLTTLGALMVAMLMFGVVAIFAETLSGEWNSRPRSLFSYETSATSKSTTSRW